MQGVLPKCASLLHLQLLSASSWLGLPMTDMWPSVTLWCIYSHYVPRSLYLAGRRSYAIGFVNSVLQTACVFRLSFCRYSIIDHFFCDIPKLLKLSCFDTFLLETISVIFSTLTALSTILPILISYICIFSTILRIHSTKGRSKAFFTYTSHLTSVALFYGTGVYVYIHPN